MNLIKRIKEALKKCLSPMFISRYITLYVTYIKNTRKNVYAKASKHTHLYGPLTLEPSFVELDDYTRLQPGVKIISAGGKFIVKKYAVISAGCTILTNNHIPTVGLPQYMSYLGINDVKSDIIVEEDAWVGADAMLMSRSRVGRGAIVGARAVVTKSVPPYAVVAGIPARIVAVRFSIEQIIEHEKILYPPNERLSREFLEELFETEYKDLRSIGTNEISDEKRSEIKKAKKIIGIDVYENCK